MYHADPYPGEVADVDKCGGGKDSDRDTLRECGDGNQTGYSSVLAKQKWKQENRRSNAERGYGFSFGTSTGVPILIVEPNRL